MANDTSTLEVYILDKPYLISCPENERESLRSAAQFLDRRMRDIRSAGKVLGLERVAVIAGLNLAHELLDARQKATAESTQRQELGRLIERLDRTLGKLQPDA